MKTLNEIYTSIKESFYKKSKLDIEQGTVIDSYVLASATAAEEAHKEIENNKTPHIYSGLRGEDIDSLGYLVNCPRYPNELDDAYLYRVINWNTMNQKSNLTAIEGALIAMEYASNVKYVPLTEGVGTGTAYIIPKKYNEDGPELAIKETKERLEKVVSPGAIISYIIPETISIKMTIYINAKDGDMTQIKNNITKKIETYINGIAPGDYFEVGEINRIGVNEINVDYFSVAQLYVNEEETTDLEVLQKIESKMLFDSIIWWAVN